MKRGFVRAAFGDVRSPTFMPEIIRVIKCPFTLPFVTYVFGKDNYDCLKKMGLKCVLIHPHPYMFEEWCRYRNKIEAYRYAMEEDGYDEMVFLDWDCIPVKPLHRNFWQEMGKKECIQGNLYNLTRFTTPWRISDRSCSINTGFLYIRNKLIPSQIIKAWDSFPVRHRWRKNDEIATAHFIDEMTRGWVGKEKWWDRFEPYCCNIASMAAYPDKLLKTKDVCFIHDV